MNIVLIVIGKTDEEWLQEAVASYVNRLKHYIAFKTIIIPALKNTKNISTIVQKQKEGELILSNIISSDVVIVLDEKGEQYSSLAFSAFINQKMNAGIKRLVFVIGGSFGFSDAIYERADVKLSLSKMTFSHQMIRLFFIEQLYRAMTILKGEKYHHF